MQRTRRRREVHGKLRPPIPEPPWGRELLTDDGWESRYLRSCPVEVPGAGNQDFCFHNVAKGFADSRFLLAFSWFEKKGLHLLKFSLFVRTHWSSAWYFRNGRELSI